MPKRPLRLKIRIPAYVTPRNSWREAIHAAVSQVQKKAAVTYQPDDRLEVELRIYFAHGHATETHDVDNRLKNCLDALQGREAAQRARPFAACRRSFPMIDKCGA